MGIETLKKICMLGEIRSTDGGKHPLSSEIILYCMHELETLGYDPVFDGDTIYAKGTVPVLLAAHMDTYFDAPLKHIVQKGNRLSSPQGIGGDDRCGIYIVLELIRQFHCSVLFSHCEEVSDDQSSSMYTFFEGRHRPESLGVNYIMEFDEPGKDGAVYYEIGNRAFEEFIEQDGYFKRHDSDGQTDIRFVTVAYNIAGVNIPCGYYHNHSEDEYINFDETEQTIFYAQKILSRATHKKFEYVSTGICLSAGSDTIVRITVKHLQYKAEYDRLFRLLRYLNDNSSYSGLSLEFAEGINEIPDHSFYEEIDRNEKKIHIRKLILPHSLYFIGEDSFSGIIVDEPVILPEHIHSLQSKTFCGKFITTTKKIKATGKLLYVSDHAISDGTVLIAKEQLV